MHTDTALSKFDFIDKEAFYLFLEKSYGVKPAEIGKKFPIFHKALAESLGSNHFAIERCITKILHDRAKKGIYGQTEEVVAFGRMVDVYLFETNYHLARQKKQKS